jgi:hypothetical protein
MIGGINNGLFFQGFGGFFVMLIFIVPLLLWAFPRSKSSKKSKKLKKEIARDLRRLKRK